MTEYDVEIISKNLGPAFDVRAARLDPRIFGIPAARARLYALAINKEKVQWAQGFDLVEFLDILTSRVVMSVHSYWWMDLPQSNLSEAEELCMHLVSMWSLFENLNKSSLYWAVLWAVFIDFLRNETSLWLDPHHRMQC